MKDKKQKDILIYFLKVYPVGLFIASAEIAIKRTSKKLRALSYKERSYDKYSTMFVDELSAILGHKRGFEVNFISELVIPGINTETLARNIEAKIGSENISEFLLVLNERSKKIKRITGIGRKTLPSLLEAIEREGYDIPRIIIF